MIKFLLVFFVSLISVLPAHADNENVQTVELSISNIRLQPGNVIKLKAMALKSQPDIEIDDLQLLAVEILGKSMQGKGQVRLRVGKKLSNWVVLGGTKESFNSDKIETFTTAKIRSPAMGHKQVWQLLINGYIKINKIVLYTTKSNSLPEGSV